VHAFVSTDLLSAAPRQKEQLRRRQARLRTPGPRRSPPVAIIAPLRAVIRTGSPKRRIVAIAEVRWNPIVLLNAIVSRPLDLAECGARKNARIKVALPTNWTAGSCKPQSGHDGVETRTAPSGVTRQRMLARPALLQRLGRSHQHDPGCEYEPDTGGRADFCLVAIAVARVRRRRKSKRSCGPRR
jgi:hypothetical protein